MEAVTRYVANDGSEFRTEEAAIARDKLIAECEAAMEDLKAVPADLNWEGYVQQDDETVPAGRCLIQPPSE